MKRVLYVVLAVFVIAGALLWYMHRGASPQAGMVHTPPQAKTYTNAKYGYSLSYPAALDVEEYPNGDAVIGAITDRSVNGVAEMHVLSLSSAPRGDFSQAAADALSNLCAADGPTGSFSCTSLASSTAFTTTDGTKGYELYLNGELTDLRTKQKTTMLKGPYFVFPLSATSTDILSIQAPLAQAAAEADAASIESIAKSLSR